MKDDAATKADLKKLETNIDKRFDEFASSVDKRFDEFASSVDKRFDDLASSVDKRFDEFASSVDKRFDDLATMLGTYANHVDARFNKVEIQLAALTSRFDEYDETLRQTNEKYDHLVTTIDAFVARIDTYETEQAARDHKVERLERWIKQLAKEADITLAD